MGFFIINIVFCFILVVPEIVVLRESNMPEIVTNGVNDERRVNEMKEIGTFHA